jgi:hypothetical protein
VGIFDWLKGKKDRVEIAEHRIWLAPEAKYAGIRKEAAAAAADPVGPTAVLVVAHFNDCLGQLQAAVAGLDPDRVLAIRADALVGRTASDLGIDESSDLLMLVGERHPQLSHDEVVVDFARSLPCHSRIVRHVSLEDAVIKRFAGQWVEQILRRLGMEEGEAIQSRMVDRRIQRAIKEVSERARGDAPADSAQEWLEKNCP